MRDSSYLHEVTLLLPDQPEAGSLPPAQPPPSHRDAAAHTHHHSLTAHSLPAPETIKLTPRNRLTGQLPAQPAESAQTQHTNESSDEGGEEEVEVISLEGGRRERRRLKLPLVDGRRKAKRKKKVS